MNRELHITIENNKMDTDFEIGISNPAVSTAHKTFIVISLLLHIVMLSAFSMMPQFFGWETPQKPSIGAVIVNFNDPLSPSRKKHSIPSGGSSGTKVRQEIKSHEEIKSAPLTKPSAEKQKNSKKKPAPSKPKMLVSKTEAQSDFYANRNPSSVKDTFELPLPAASSEGAIKEKTSDSVPSEQEASASDASVAGGAGSSGQNFGKGCGSGTEKGSLPEELGMEEVEQIPRVIKTTEPAYPLSARRRNIEGKITVKFLVSITGEVSKPSVVSAEPEGIFEESVLNAVVLWRFKPGMYQGKAVATWMKLPVLFKIH